MKLNNAIPSAFLAMTLVTFSVGAFADGILSLDCDGGAGKGGVSYQVSTKGEGSACLLDSKVPEGEKEIPVICSDNKGETARASCDKGCGDTARSGTCEKISPPPPPPPATSTGE